MHAFGKLLTTLLNLLKSKRYKLMFATQSPMLLNSEHQELSSRLRTDRLLMYIPNIDCQYLNRHNTYIKFLSGEVFPLMKLSFGQACLFNYKANFLLIFDFEWNTRVCLRRFLNLELVFAFLKSRINLGLESYQSLNNLDRIVLTISQSEESHWFASSQ